MKDIKTIVEQTKECSPKQRRDALRPYANKSGIGTLFIMLKGKEKRSALRALTDLCAIPSAAEIINHYMSIHRTHVRETLYCDDPKARKTCAELVGRLCADDFAADLTNMLKQEDAFFVLPSVILAIGNTSKAAKILEGYEVPDCEEKHKKDISEALRKALMVKGNEDAHINPLKKGTVLLLSCPSDYVTRRELTEIGIENKNCPFLRNTVMVYNVRVYENVFKSRTFYSASVYLGSSKEERIPAKRISAMFEELFGKNTSYRIEYTSDFELSSADRKKMCADIAAQITEHTNTTSGYICTLHVHKNGRGLHYHIRPSDKLDKRFEYRKHAISASAHPAVAASCVYFARQWQKDNANVLDCFCGSGTMLFARGKYPSASLIGTDIEADALKAARVNERFAHTGARFIMKNALSPFKERFDEVISNLPFGLRVSDHEGNRHLYREFFANLESILKPGAHAFLLTQEKELIKKSLEHHQAFELIAKHTFSAGGLFPSLYVIKRK